MVLLVGLGNPGPQYTLTRHNVGLLLLMSITQKYFFSNVEDKGQYLTQEGWISGEKVIAIRPMVYMNLSGLAVSEALKLYKVPLDKVIVIHDDLGIKLCQVKVKYGGGTGGHNGLKSLDQYIGSGYGRLRIGVGHPGSRDLVSKYVLGEFTENAKTHFVSVLNAVTHEIPSLIKGDKMLFLRAVSIQLGDVNKI